MKPLDDVAAEESGQHEQRSRFLASCCHALVALLLTLLFAPQPLQAQPLAAENRTPAVVPPRAVSADVSYPEGATGKGTVVLEVTVDAAGAVTDAQVVSGDAAFTAAALTQAGAFRFEPAQRDGRPVAARIRLVLEFTPPEPAAESAPPPVEQNRGLITFSAPDVESRRPVTPRLYTRQRLHRPQHVRFNKRWY